MELDKLFFPDTFNSYFVPEIAIAAVEVLEAAGCEVVIPPRPLRCARPPVCCASLRDELVELLPRILDSGCCGMAGSLGFEAEHYEVAMKCGERVLLPEVRAAPTETLIMTDGYSAASRFDMAPAGMPCIWPGCFAGRNEKATVNARLEEIVKSKQLQAGAERTFAIVMDTGDEAMPCLSAFAQEQHLSAARFTGLGAFSEVLLGFFAPKEKDYRRISVREQVEVASLIGDIALAGSEPKVHAHVVVTKADGSAWGGHLLEGHVRPTLEVLLVESPAHLHRKHDPETGLPLIAL